VTERVRVTRAEAIGRVALARPEKKNALDRRTAEELTAALESLADDATVRVIALTGDGDDFCAGADLEALESLIDADRGAHYDDARALATVFRTIRKVSRPVVAAVKGRALAGGAGLATACDIVLAHENAQFGYPEVRVGFVPAMVMSILARSASQKHAFDLVASGRVIAAAEAERMGLVSRVFPAATFEADVEGVVAGLAKSPPQALALTKKLFYQLDQGFSDDLGLGIEANVAARMTDDFREGVRRFTQRRKPETP
jgi:methylglutaconyl-CoA hydratase